MIHYMLNTGVIEPEPRSNTSDAVLRLLAPIYDPGSHPFPIMEYRAEVVETPAGCFCLVIGERNELPLISVAVAEDSFAANQLWPELVRFHDIMKSWNGTAPISAAFIVQPTSAPWYATMEIFTDPSEASFLREFSRHFAWGWIDRQQGHAAWSNRQRFR